MIFRSLEHRFTVASDDPALEDFAQRVFAPLVQPPTESADDALASVAPTRYFLAVTSTSNRGLLRLLADEQPICETGNPSEPFRRLIREINVRTVTASAARFVVLHAGAVGCRSGAVLFPQSPGAGKSTLVAGLMQRGWHYLSDELVAIDPTTLHIHGARRAITLRSGSWGLFPAGWIDAPASVERFLPQRRFLAPPKVERPPVLPTADIVLYEYGIRGATEARADHRDPVSSLSDLLGASFTLTERPQRDLTTLARLVERSRTWNLIASRDLNESCDELASRLRSRAPGDGGWRSSSWVSHP